MMYIITIKETKARAAASSDRKIGRAIRNLRLAAGLSQTDVGGHLGVTYQQIQKYENGISSLAADKLFDLCRLYGVSPEAVMGGGAGRGARQTVPSVLEMDDDTVRICRRLTHVNDRVLKRKIIAVIDILMA